MSDVTSASPAIRLVLADDHPIVRDGLRGICESAAEFDVVGEASNGIDAASLALRLEPDVVLMDLRMPAGDGVDAIRQLVASGCRSHVLVLTTYDTDHDVMAAIDAGATGYLLKDAPREDLFAAIRAAARGEAVLSPAVASRVVSRARASRPDALSSREADVLALVAEGRSNVQIARTLFVSEATIKTHLGQIYRKLGVHERAAAVAAAYERGYLGS